MRITALPTYTNCQSFGWLQWYFSLSFWSSRTCFSIYHNLLVLGSRLLLMIFREPMSTVPFPITPAAFPLLREKVPFVFSFPFPFPLFPFPPFPTRARSLGSRGTSFLISGLGNDPGCSGLWYGWWRWWFAEDGLADAVVETMLLGEFLPCSDCWRLWAEQVKKTGTPCTAHSNSFIIE